MTNVDALKALYTALGGSADDVAGVTTNSDMIYKIAAVVSAGGGSVLPAVTTDDNGKVLKVANGKWAVGTDAT